MYTSKNVCVCGGGDKQIDKKYMSINEKHNVDAFFFKNKGSISFILIIHAAHIEKGFNLKFSPQCRIFWLKVCKKLCVYSS